MLVYHGRKWVKSMVYHTAKLSSGELALLLNKLGKQMRALGYSLEDIPIISPDLCMHIIHLEDNPNPQSSTKEG